VVSDVTLTGSARRIAGSDDESGTATLRALSSGAARLDLSLLSGTRSEFRSPLSEFPTGGWSGPDGVVHAIPYHNLIGDWGWFPVFTLANASTVQSSVLTLVGTETRNGQSVIHVTEFQQFPNLTPDNAALMQHLSQIDIFLDSATLLPSVVSYNAHADRNVLRDIPVEIHFSDYRTVNGAQIPFHIQKFQNNSLLLDLQFQSATLNTGLTAAQVGGAQ